MLKIKTVCTLCGPYLWIFSYISFRYSGPLLPHIIPSLLWNQEVNAYLKWLHANWMTQFALLELCFSHHVTLFRSFHFIAFCGSKDTVLDRGILDVVSGETFTEEKQAGHWHQHPSPNPLYLPPLHQPNCLQRWQGIRWREIHEYVTWVSPRSVSWKTLGQPWGRKK